MITKKVTGGCGIMNKAILFVLTLVMLTSAVFALPIAINEVQIGGTEVLPNEINALSQIRGSELLVRVEFTALEDAKNVDLLLFIAGYDDDENRISQTIGPMDLSAGVRYTKEVSLQIPMDVNVDKYKLRLIASDNNGQPLVESYNLALDTKKHLLMIEDVLVVPGTSVKAGQGVIAKVRVLNAGQDMQKNVRVRATIPELGVEQVAFINKVASGDEQDESEDLLLRIPLCAKAGTYTMNVDAVYRGGRETTTKSMQLTVAANDRCFAQTSGGAVVSVGENMKGAGKAIFPLTVVNTASASKTYSLVIETPVGIEYVVSPTMATVLEPGQAKTFYVDVMAAEGAKAGPQVVTARVMSSGQMIKEVSFTANVQGSHSSWKRALEVTLVIMIVLLLVIAAVFGVSRMRGDNDGGRATTYY